MPDLIRQIVHTFLGLSPPKIQHGGLAAEVALRARELAENGLTLKQIAETLREEGFLTAKGGEHWDPTQVRRLLNGSSQGGEKTGLC